MVFKSLKAHVSRHALLTLALCSLAPLPALADVPVFSPAAPWSVNAGQLSTVRGLKPMKLPCVLSTEYDNGFVVRFSGGGNKMLALAIDFRQDVFKQGRQYDAMVTVGGGYIKQISATAFTPSTLIFNLRPLGDFYAVAQKGGEMEIDIDGNVLKFDLARIGNSYKELESCYAGGNAAEPVAPLEEAKSKVPVAAVESAPVTAGDENTDRENFAAKPKSASKNVDKPAPVEALPEDVAQKEMPRSFDDLVRNADQEGTAPRRQMKTAQVTPRAPEDGTGKASGATKEAAAKASSPRQQPIISRDGNDDGMATMPPSTVQKQRDIAAAQPQQKPAGAPIPLTPAPVTASPLPPAETQVAAKAPAAAAATAPARAVPATPKAWEAKAGEDMKIVLSRWAERAGYDLDWESDQDGKVVQDIRYTGRFEDAVGQLLAENSAATGIGAHVQTLSGDKKDIAMNDRSVPDPAPRGPAVRAVIPALHDEWTAAPGANIQAVLDQWSSKAGVAIVWQSYMDVPVKQPLQLTGTYEEAVETLLNQYEGDSRRPVAQLNIDPESGARTLLVDISG